MNSNKGAHIIFLVSDGTGETAEKAVRAVLIQHPQVNYKIVRYKMIRSEQQVKALVEEAERRDAIVVYTMVIAPIRELLSDWVMRHNVKHIDLLGAVVESFSRFFGTAPTQTPGLLHEVNEDYYRRIEAMEFTVKHDDGNLIENLKRADIVLLGVSRTSKTPLSIYLSHKGYKVANVPLVKGIDPPSVLRELDAKKVFALTIDPDVLANIRKERLIRMGKDAEGDYCDLTHVRSEVAWAQHIFDRNRRWIVLDVTNKALEETAADIERRIQSRMSLSELLESE